MGKAKRKVSPKVKFQVVLEALTEDKTLGQIAKCRRSCWSVRQYRRAGCGWS